MLCVLIAGQAAFGIYAVAKVAMGPRELPSSSFVRVRDSSASSGTVARDRPRPVQGLLSAAVAIWGALVYQSSDCFRYALTRPPIWFHSPHRGLVDLVAFLMVLVRTKRSRTNRYPGIPNILDAILRDATVYFLVIFISQLIFQLFVFVAPVSSTPYVCGN